MAQLKESLSTEVLDSIKSKRDEISNLVMELGQLTLKKREFKNEVSRLEEIESAIENRFDEINSEMTDILKELETKYSKGEIDLNEGVVYYESED
jgi:chromosome segregation ATPase